MSEMSGFLHENHLGGIRDAETLQIGQCGGVSGGLLSGAGDTL